MTYDIFTYAQKILKDREEYHDKVAHETNSYTTTQSTLSMASAYHSAWWILYYAIHEDWEALEQYDYYNKEEQE